MKAISYYHLKALLRLLLSVFTLFSLSVWHMAARSQTQLLYPHNTIQNYCAVCQDPSSLISRTSHLKSHVLKLALKAYACAQSQNIGKTRWLTIIDYSLPSTVKRLWVIDLFKKRVLFNTLVSHGKGSGKKFARVFSDRPESQASSLGLFLTGRAFKGHHGLSLRLHGLEKGFNDEAFARDIVIHSAWYVSEHFAKQYGYIGRSWGCPALNEKVIHPIINRIKGGSLLFAYYPDLQWLKQSRFLHCTD